MDKKLSRASKTTQQHEYERRLTVARNEFYGAAVNLLNIWQEDQSGELLINGYPFKTAFEEVVASIGTWSLQKVKKGRVKKYDI